MVWVVPVTVAWETSVAVSQLPVVCFHSTVYLVTLEPPLDDGAVQDASSVPGWVPRSTVRSSGAVGTMAATARVATLVRDSSFSASSVNETLTLMVLPTSFTDAV